jgi:hypothetical protein
MHVSQLRTRHPEAQENVVAGVGITHNALYINPSKFIFQPPLWREMCHEDLAIQGSRCSSPLIQIRLGRWYPLGHLDH